MLLSRVNWPRRLCKSANDPAYRADDFVDGEGDGERDRESPEWWREYAKPVELRRHIANFAKLGGSYSDSEHPNFSRLHFSVIKWDEIIEWVLFLYECIPWGSSEGLAYGACFRVCTR